jgi:hypothetical protein
MNTLVLWVVVAVEEEKTRILDDHDGRPLAFTTKEEADGFRACACAGDAEMLRAWKVVKFSIDNRNA